MRALAMTGMVTPSWISRILSGSAMRATPPSRRMSAGTRSRAMTATAPASSAIRACSAVVTSMITPPFSISARPPLTRMVPISVTSAILLEARAHEVLLCGSRLGVPEDDGRALEVEQRVQPLPLQRRPGRAAVPLDDQVGVLAGVAECDREPLAVAARDQRSVRRRRSDEVDVRGVDGHLETRL